MRHTFFIIIILCTGIYSCREHFSDSANKENTLAVVGEKVLTLHDVKHILGEKYKDLDSSKIIKAYIDKWIKQQLLLKKAEQNLSSETKDVRRELDEYRTSLLVYKYEQQYIKQKLDTTVKFKEIEEYYQANLANFILDKNIVKALFMKLPNISPNIKEVKKWYKSNDPDDIAKLENYCFQYANKFDDFEDQWIIFENILKQIPISINNREQFLKYNRSIETSDSLFHYFVHIKDYKQIGKEAPIDFIEKNIHSIILNKRKIKLINELENNIYNNAVMNSSFKTYSK